MNPATKKTLSDCFPLLCKRFKQRDQRHMVEKEKTIFDLVSAKNLGYGDHPLRVVNCGGRLIKMGLHFGLCSVHFVHGYRPHFVRLLTEKDGKGWDGN